MKWKDCEKMGNEVLSYLKQYETTEHYKIVAEAIQFGYQLCEIGQTYKEFENSTILDKIDWAKITDNDLVIQLLKEREGMSELIREIDKEALLNYEWQILQNSTGIE